MTGGSAGKSTLAVTGSVDGSVGLAAALSGGRIGVRDTRDMRTDAKAAVAEMDRSVRQSRLVIPTAPVPMRARKAWAKVRTARDAAAFQKARVNMGAPT
jgi:hypothetical protein